MSITDIHPDLQIDTYRISIPVRVAPRTGNSIWKTFFDTLTIGTSFTVDAKKDSRVRAAFIGYSKKHNPKYSLVGRKVEGTTKHRFWAVEKIPYKAS